MLLFNNKNKLFKIFPSHNGKVNSISIDKSGDTIATAGEDGNVYIQILSENSRIPHKYNTAIRVLVLVFDFYCRVFVWILYQRKRCLFVVV